MSWDQLSDFEQQMYFAVVDEASLAEVAQGREDLVDGVIVLAHGPWEPAACSTQLLHWFDQGLVELYDMREGHPTNRPDIAGPPGTRNGRTGLIPPDSARKLLAAWQHWGDDGEQWMCTRLVVTDLGMHKLDEVVGLIP